jgi:hypothetical protein
MRRAVIVLASMLAAAPGGTARASDLAGAWSGGGSFQISGNIETARCNVSYSRAAGSSYTAFATCATKTARVTQSASLRRIGGNEYAGSFYNNEYGVTGTIHVVVSGSNQAVSLAAAGGSGSFRLSKR